MNSQLHSVAFNDPMVSSERVCELDELIEEALATVRSAGRKKDILFARTTGHDGLRVLVDPMRAAGMIAAVLANAIDRSPKRGIVTVDIRPQDEQIDVAVSDQGWKRHGGPPFEDALIAFDRVDGMNASIAHLRTEEDGSTVVLGFKRA